jgi:ABC-2 type transport system ATP-binding protein
MKQRRGDPEALLHAQRVGAVGIVAALLDDPRLLILDEPTNGLDPAGIREIRDLLSTLAGDGTTVLVSSHLLSEIETVCDDLVVLRRGRLVFSGPVERLLDAAAPVLVARPERPADAARLRDLAAADGHAAWIDDGAVHIEAPRDIAGELNRRAAAVGITLVELRTDRRDLEDLFFEITEAAA